MYTIEHTASLLFLKRLVWPGVNASSARIWAPEFKNITQTEVYTGTMPAKRILAELLDQRITMNKTIAVLHFWGEAYSDGCRTPTTKKLVSVLVLPEAWWENYPFHHRKAEAGSWSETTIHLAISALASRAIIDQSTPECLWCQHQNAL